MAFLMLPPTSLSMASAAKSTSSARGSAAGHAAAQMRARSASSGSGKITLNVSRRRNASSIWWRMFVARMATPRYASIFCRRYETSRLAYRSCESLTSLRLPNSASASSKKRIAFESAAAWNTRSRFFSVSPIHLLTTPARSMRNSARPSSPAITSAAIVFPVPETPLNNAVIPVPPDRRSLKPRSSTPSWYRTVRHSSASCARASSGRMSCAQVARGVSSTPNAASRRPETARAAATSSAGPAPGAPADPRPAHASATASTICWTVRLKPAARPAMSASSVSSSKPCAASAPAQASARSAPVGIGICTGHSTRAGERCRRLPVGTAAEKADDRPGGEVPADRAQYRFVRRVEQRLAAGPVHRRAQQHGLAEDEPYRVDRVRAGAGQQRRHVDDEQAQVEAGRVPARCLRLADGRPPTKRHQRVPARHRPRHQLHRGTRQGSRPRLRLVVYAAEQPLVDKVGPEQVAHDPLVGTGDPRRQGTVHIGQRDQPGRHERRRRMEVLAGSSRRPGQGAAQAQQQPDRGPPLRDVVLQEAVDPLVLRQHLRRRAGDQDRLVERVEPGRPAYEREPARVEVLTDACGIVAVLLEDLLQLGDERIPLRVEPVVQVVQLVEDRVEVRVAVPRRVVKLLAYLVEAVPLDPLVLLEVRDQLLGAPLALLPLLVGLLLRGLRLRLRRRADVGPRVGGLGRRERRLQLADLSADRLLPVEDPAVHLGDRLVVAVGRTDLRGQPPPVLQTLVVVPVERLVPIPFALRHSGDRVEVLRGQLHADDLGGLVDQRGTAGRHAHRGPDRLVTELLLQRLHRAGQVALLHFGADVTRGPLVRADLRGDGLRLLVTQLRPASN